MIKSKYTTLKTLEDSKNYLIVIEDLYDSNNPTMSVTNDIDRIFEKEMIGKENKKNFVIYKNTDAKWDITSFSTEIDSVVWDGVSCDTFEEVYLIYDRLKRK